MSSPRRPSIEFWFDLSSNYSYLSVMRIEDAARQAGVDVLWRPFLLGPIFKALGWEAAPFVVQKEKGAYVWQDMQRQCRKYGLPWRQPTVFPRRTLLATRIAVLADNAPWQPAWCREIMRLNYGEDRDVDTPEVATAVLEQLGLPAAQILDAALGEENRQRLRAATETARERGVFGAPTFFVGDDLYWGNDRLDDALSAAASHAERAAP
ncbi:MAG TPA: 2-hydroxychromene-2-carboxylate isomerase [Paraburkholderia sp.]|jgi:2-hydroxychromene-2-carboxylate isomerase|nr:2-hydroxychromene-2-carboxylate isomerase [Paraburkholderia sp.]